MGLAAGTRLQPAAGTDLPGRTTGERCSFASSDGRRLYAADVKDGSPIVIGTPRVVFEGAMLGPQFGTEPYDVLPDGRLVVILRADPERADNATPSLVLVQNWTEQLRRLVPVE